MSEHLRHEEFVDAIEHTLDAARQAHLDSCEQCRSAVGELGSTLNDARSVDLPEPSPLFWDHFSNRVREATARETMTVARWWHPSQWWRPVGILASALAAAVLVMVLRPWHTSTPVAGEPVGEVQAFVTPPDDGSWGLVIGLASDLDAKDVREVAKPREGTADAMIAELSPAQRRALAQLIKDEIGEQ